MTNHQRLLDLVQPHLLQAPPYVPVQPPEVLAQRLGVPVERIDKLDANENPYGPSPKAVEALAKHGGYHIYPDPEQRRLREVLGNYVGYGSEWIVPGAGSDELIELCCRLFMGPEQSLLNFPPTFGMYSFLAGTLGRGLVNVQRRDDFGLDIEGTLSAAEDAGLIFAASPNNPTGNSLTRAEVDALLSTGRPVVIDEAYAEFAGSSYVPLVRERPNLIIIRTLSKWAGLAGLRVGYMVCDPAVAEITMRIKQPYNINVAAEVASLASFSDIALLRERVDTIRGERDRLAAGLAELPGFTVYPSTANFVLCRIDGIEAKRVQQKLMDRGIMVRFFDTALLQNHLRFSAGRPDQTDRLLAALKDIVPAGSRVS
ncbi:MAG: histidinol-phosphate transaminase [Dehalococcoidia bacterium]